MHPAVTRAQFYFQFTCDSSMLLITYGFFSSTAGPQELNAGFIICAWGSTPGSKGYHLCPASAPLNIDMLMMNNTGNKSPSAATGNPHNGSSVGPWHFYHPTCVPGSMLRQWRANNCPSISRTLGGMLLVSSDTPSGDPAGCVWPGGVFYRSLSRVGSISFLEQWWAAPEADNNAWGGQSSNLSGRARHYRCWPAVGSVWFRRWYISVEINKEG